ncbi:MAG: glycoside hydrolase family 10 protein [Candidatus Sumerlaeaceae bacterium]
MKALTVGASVMLVLLATTGWGAANTEGQKQTAAGKKATAHVALEPGQADSHIGETTPSVTEEKSVHWTQPDTEFRGIWLPGKELLATTEAIARKLDAIARANFNAVLPDAYFQGYVIYPNSNYLPQLPAARGGDPLRSFIEKAHKRGLEVHVWLEYGFYAYHTPDATKDPSKGPWLDAHPELQSVSAKGDLYVHNPAWGDFYSMCPSNPRCHELIANIAAEILERYPVEGINLDRIRYAGESFCYCDYCKKHFKEDTGIELVEFKKGSQGEKKFLEWKRQQLVKALETIRKRVKSARPEAVLTSYVVPPAEKDNKAQPWDLWAKERLLDAIAVSMYGRSIVADAERAVKILGNDKDVLLAAISCEVPSSAYLENIEKARRYAPLGQITWYSGQVDDDLEGLLSGPYAKPARSPFAREFHTSASATQKGE